MSRDALRDAVPLGEIARALVIMLRHHGDVLLASPVLSALKAQAPQIGDRRAGLRRHRADARRPSGARAAARRRAELEEGRISCQARVGETALRRAARAPLRPARAPHRAAARRLARARAGRALQRRAGGARARRVLGAKLHAPLSAARATAAATRSRRTSTRCAASACSRAWRSAACSSSRARRREARIAALLAAEGLAERGLRPHPSGLALELQVLDAPSATPS